MRLLALAAGCLIACDSGGSSRVSSVEVVAEANPLNALAMRLRVHAPGATTARAEWTEEAELRRSPPVLVGAGGETVVHVLGLQPSTRYEAVVEIEGPAGPRRSAPVEFATGPSRRLWTRSRCGWRARRPRATCSWTCSRASRGSWPRSTGAARSGGTGSSRAPTR